MKLSKRLMSLLLTALVWAVAAQAADEKLKIGEVEPGITLYEGKQFLHVMHQGRSIKVQRVQDPEYQLQGYYAKTARQCPPFCLKPMTVDPRVATVGEIEIFEFMENELRDGKGLLIDARTPTWFGKGTIPGSINIPFTTLSKGADDPGMTEALKVFGAKPRKDVGGLTRTMEEWGLADGEHKTDKWDFSQCKELILWCNGPECGQSPRAIKGLLSVGYPPEKMRYYRGGMQIWQLWGLTTVTPES